MNEAKVTEYLGNIFHLETCIGENGNYEISSNYWGLKFNVRIREFTIFIQDGLGAKCSIDSDEDKNTIAREIVGFVGDVLKDVSKTFVYDGTNSILSWPYNCNLAYVDYLKQAMDMGADENLYEYEARKAGLNSSKKQIKSDRVLDDYHNKEIYRQAFASLIEDAQPDEQYPGSYRVLVDGCFETNFLADSQEEAIQKFKDYFANKKKGINNSKKPIKSSFVENLKKDNGLDYFTVPELQQMNYEKLKNGEITDDEYLENDELITKYKGKINSSRNQSSLDRIFS